MIKEPYCCLLGIKQNERYKISSDGNRGVVYIVVAQEMLL